MGHLLISKQTINKWSLVSLKKVHGRHWNKCDALDQFNSSGGIARLDQKINARETIESCCLKCFPEATETYVAVINLKGKQKHWSTNIQSAIYWLIVGLIFSGKLLSSKNIVGRKNWWSMLCLLLQPFHPLLFPKYSSVLLRLWLTANAIWTAQWRQKVIKKEG